MADEAPQQDTPVADGSDDSQGGEQQPDEFRSATERSVPYNRFAQVNRELKQLRQERESFVARLEEIESKEQTEAQRDRKKNQQLERERDELGERLTQMERQRWLIDAARELKFDDPEDATAFIDVKDVEDPDDAVHAVKDLAKRKPKLLRAESAPDIAQVVRNGQQVRHDRQQQNGAPVPQPEMDQASQEFLSQLNDAKAASGWQSIPLE